VADDKQRFDLPTDDPDVEGHTFDDLDNVDDLSRSKEEPDVEGHLMDDLDHLEEGV
jgi:hypothetical protein